MNRNVAILMTCFNRKIKTLNCLTSLFNILPNCDVYLVDDGSNDGTSDAVKIAFPQVNVIQGTGNLFWSRGMHLAWQEASKCDYDYYLWLNDDVVLYPDFWEELNFSLMEAGKDSLVVGAIENVDKSKIIYGGVNANLKRVKPSGKVQQLYLINGNVVLVPRKIADAIGVIDPKFHHDLGDLDYGLRVRRGGFEVVLTTKSIGFGYENHTNRFRKSNSSIRTRLTVLFSPLGANPKIYFYFYRKHFGIFKALTRYSYLIFINLLPDWGYNYIFNNK